MSAREAQPEKQVEEDSARHWTHIVLWPISKRAYCRFWSARLAWRTYCAMIVEGKATRGTAWAVFLIELLRPNQTIKMTVTKGSD